MATLRAETVSSLFDLLSSPGLTRESAAACLQLYSHPDYALEIERYHSRGTGSGLTPSNLSEALRSLVLHGVESRTPDLSPHERRVSRLISNYQAYRRKWEGFMQGWQSTLVRSDELARRYLPSEASISEVDVLVTVGLGDSFGWPFRDAIHFDLVHMLDNFDSFLELENLLAHELHHVGYQSLLSTFDAATSSHKFLLFLAYEGMAIKFFNHPNSVFSTCVNDEMRGYQIVAADWDYYREHWDYYFREFQSDYRYLCQTPDADISSMIMRWMTDERIDGSGAKLVQYPNYFIGSEIVGLLFDHCGLHTIFDVLGGRSEFEVIYDRILEEIGLSGYTIRP